MVHFILVPTSARGLVQRSAALCCDQPGYPDEIVGNQIEQKVGRDASGASMFGLAHGSVLLAHPKMHSAMARHDCDMP
jgi:hypothetical protein